VKRLHSAATPFSTRPENVRHADSVQQHPPFLLAVFSAFGGRAECLRGIMTKRSTAALWQQETRFGWFREVARGE
jgi:hypothetical protein